MRNQSGLPIFQKFLGWAQRFFFQQASGTLPDPHLVLEIGVDWPLETQLLTPADYVTIAGSLPTVISAPGAQEHALVYLATVSVVAGGGPPATDSIGLLLRSPNGDGARPFDMSGLAVATGAINLIGGTRMIGTTGIRGALPIYVGPLQELRIVHDSVAGGVTMRPRVWQVIRPAYYPLRLP